MGVVLPHILFASFQYYSRLSSQIDTQGNALFHGMATSPE